jgi:DNA-directed RNA polymerase specialized sigma24 family protein
MKSILWRLWADLREQCPQYAAPTSSTIIDRDDEDEPLTLADVADYERAQCDAQAWIPEAREAALLHEIREAMKGLTAQERKIIRMSYFEEKSQAEIHNKIPGSIGTKNAIAIRKLRKALRAKGYDALPESAPVDHASCGRPRS